MDSPGYKYKPEYANLAYNYCLLGAKNEQLAEFFGVSTRAINYWVKDKPKFRKAVHDGRTIADAEIARAIYQRAKGYSHPEEKIFNHNGEAMRVETMKHYPPDTQAARLWLINRQRQWWTDTQNVEMQADVTSKNVNINADMDPQQAADLYEQLISTD